MKFLYLLTLFTSISALALPKLDPKKYTVCAMTMNSDNERKVFEEQIKKSNKYNPMVELTEFGTAENWFQKACASGIRCDQVIISGHFASTWSGTSKLKLPLKTMEKAGCSNTCDGIMDHPYEVFLFGCNTLSTKALDHRTPDTYLQHLLEDGYNRRGAENAVEERYGKTGDDNKTRIQRSFRGSKKQLYGFDSVGPSGKNVEGLLRDYFSKTKIEEGLEKVQAARLIGNIDTLNNELATSLRITAFEQCEAGADSERDKRICKLLNDKVSVDDKLEVVRDALESENWIKYMPTINDFFKANPLASMNEYQKSQVAELAESNVIKNQVKNLIQSSNSLVIQLEWVKFARNFKYLKPKEESDALGNNLNRMLASGLNKNDADLICSLKADLQGRFKADANRQPASGPNTARGMGCLTAGTPAKAAPKAESKLSCKSLGLDCKD